MSNRDSDRSGYGGGWRSDRDGRGDDRRDKARHSPETRSWGDGRDEQPRSREQSGQAGYGQSSGRAGYGEGGYPDRSPSGGHGPRGYGADLHTGARRGGGMPTYGEPGEDRLARRSQWREDQRYGDRHSTGETWRSGDPEHLYGAVDPQVRQDWRSTDEGDRDHEPHYRAWREQQLSGHDRDYARWRQEQARRYDDDYLSWRAQRHESFSRDFHDWRNRQAEPTPGANQSRADEGAGRGGAEAFPGDALRDGPADRRQAEGAAGSEATTDQVRRVTDGQDRSSGADDAEPRH